MPPPGAIHILVEEMPIGKLVYNVWAHLYKACVELELIR
jgi:hypothetical protein